MRVNWSYLLCPWFTIRFNPWKSLTISDIDVRVSSQVVECAFISSRISYAFFRKIWGWSMCNVLNGIRLNNIIFMSGKTPSLSPLGLHLSSYILQKTKISGLQSCCRHYSSVLLGLMTRSRSTVLAN